MKDVEIIKARNVLSSRTRANLAKRLRVAAYCRVSTDSEDQLNSYKSQVQHYTDLIKSKPEWDLAGIYADEAITGTQVTKREDFQRLINDCMNGDVDMIITKSISRFARNTLDTLKYVRMLKEKGIAVFFEEENINTLTMDGELLLVILSSVAQQEVENISANVKKGLKMKMQRGELVGFQGCLGYDYHPEDKSITINEEEAEIVRYIFRRYIEGAGGSVISQELEHLGYKTKRGSTRWAETTVIGIIKNEKYKGDILMGKTFTLDPISKRRLDNFGEEDQFYIRDHHEAIISEEMFEKAQEILKRRAKPRRLGTDGKREKFSRKYAFSCMLECGFCGSTLTRRSWHSGSQYNKVIWQCVTATKKGKKFCPDSKGIAEETIEQAFIESYRLLCQNNKDVLDEFIARTEETLSDGNAGKQLAKVEKDIAALDAKRAKLVDMRLEEIIDKDTYEQKYFDLSSQIEQLQKQREDLQESAETESTMKKRIAEFRKTLEENEVLDTFDRYVFESIVEKVIVGGYDEDGNKDPSMLTFIYKTGFKNSLDGTNFKPPRKNSKTAKQNAGLCSHTTDEAKSMYSYHSNNTYRDGMLALPLTVGIIGLRYSTDLVLAVATVEAIQEKYHVMEKIDRRCDMSEKLKVLIINGSPRAGGNTSIALREMETVFEQNGVECETVQIGAEPVRGCIACGYCIKNDKCVFDDAVNALAEKFKAADGLVLASPVYFASANATLVACLDRLFYSTGFDKTMKVGASVVCARRGGCSATFDELNKYFTISGMPIASGQYWNSIHGRAAGEAELDEEGRQSMRTLARNMTFLMKSIALGKEKFGLPEKEEPIATNFIR